MSHPERFQRGSIIKIRGVLQIAARNADWAANLEKNPSETIRAAGIDLTDQEVASIADIVSGTKDSTYASPPEGTEDRYPELRAIWANLKRAK